MTKHYTSEGTLLIRNSDIKDGRFEFGDKPIYLEKSFAQENESRMHQVGDVITVHTGDVGTSAVITENEAKSIGFATIVTRPDQQIIDPNYLCTFLNTDKHKKWAVAISTGDGRTNYNLGDYYELVVPVPSIREQQKISSFVHNLNNLITLHQRKCQIDGCRFQSPLAITWEQRKLGEVAKYRNGKAHENCIDESGKYIVVNSKFVSTNGTVIKHSNMQNEPLAQNEIAFVLSDVPNGRAIARTFLVEENDKYTLNQRIAGITSSENTYPYFLHILMNRHPYFLAFDDGVKQTNLSVSDVLNFETYYPEYEEQKQIGEYFRNLDRLITLHQCE